MGIGRFRRLTANGFYPRDASTYNENGHRSTHFELQGDTTVGVWGGSTQSGSFRKTNWRQTRLEIRRTGGQSELE